MTAEGILPIGCDVDVPYRAVSKRTGLPNNSGVATWYLIHVFDGVETQLAFGDVPYTGGNNGNYFANIPSTATGPDLIVPDDLYIVRVVFSGAGEDDMIQKVLRARYKS